MKIATAAVYVEDQERALKFWTEQVGFVVHRRHPMGPGGDWIEVGPEGAESCLVIYPRAMMNDWAERKPSIVFECDDIKSRHTGMSARGVQFTQPPKEMPWGPFAIFLDSESNLYGLREERPRRAAQTVRHISASIERPPDEVYAFACNPMNLPKWATGLSGSIKMVHGEWIAESPMGKVKIRFVEANTLGVLDHEVVLESGVRIWNPMRVVARGNGSEIIFTLFRQPDMSDQKFSEDARWVEKDLMKLKGLLEK